MQQGMLCSLGCLFVLLAGCGSGGERTYPVTGKIAFPDGAPLANARVTFESTEKPISATGTSDANGVYKLTTYNQDDGAIAGNHRVVVIPPPPPTPEYDESKGGRLDDLPAQSDVIKPKYKSFDTSGLTYTVKGSGDTFDITVEKP